MIVVLGSGRSGTSLVAGVLTLLGFDPGARLIPADETNPKGHFEDLPLWKLAYAAAPREAIEEYLERTDHPLRLIKVPQIADYLPIAFPPGARFVWAHRDIDRAVKSAYQAYGADWDDEPKLRRMYGKTRDFLRDREHLRIEFDDALRAPAATVETIARYVGVAPNQAALAFVSPEVAKIGAAPERSGRGA